VAKWIHTDRSFPLRLQPELRTLLALVLPPRVLSTSKVNLTRVMNIVGIKPLLAAVRA
jgi:hypothetical protein